MGDIAWYYSKEEMPDFLDLEKKRFSNSRLL